MNTKAWIQAARLRTLPLAVAGILAGAAPAIAQNVFNGTVFSFSVLTAVLLQVLSNFANDYGDYKNGADLAGRIGPARAVQSGLITPGQMKRAMLLFSIISFVSGIALLYVSDVFSNSSKATFYLILGICCIGAAITYTVGKKAYGYRGWGDAFVGLFFGPVSVYGSYYLHTGSHDMRVLLPSVMIGCWSMAVLHLNNMRDMVSDARAGKHTLALRLGMSHSKSYHLVLMTLPVVCWAVYSSGLEGAGRFFWLIPGAISVLLMRDIYLIKKHASFDPYLKKTALLAFASSVLLLISSV